MDWSFPEACIDRHIFIDYTHALTHTSISLMKKKKKLAHTYTHTVHIHSYELAQVQPLIEEVVAGKELIYMHFFSLKPMTDTHPNTLAHKQIHTYTHTKATILIEADGGLIRLIQIYIHHFRLVFQQKH